ncbi:MAG: hypothetical protein AAGA92_10750 [Planctomycetota bacterium]
MNARCLLFDNRDNRVRLGSYRVPELRQGEVLLRAEYSCISPGTELRCLRGSETGTPEIPYIPGYALVGRVADENGTGLKEGTRVFVGGADRTGSDVGNCWGGHCEYAVASADALRVPEEIDPVEAALTKLGAIACHGLAMSKPHPGEKVLHIGLGVLGQLSARVHQQAGADVLGCDLVDSRVAACEAYGVPAVSSREGIQTAARRVMPDGCTLLVDSTGVPGVLPQAVHAIADLPWDDQPATDRRYLIQGSYEKDVPVPYHEAFFRELTILIPRDSKRTDAESFLALLGAGSLKVRDLVHDVRSPEDCAEAYDALTRPEEVPGTIVFDWR